MTEFSYTASRSSELESTWRCTHRSLTQSSLHAGKEGAARIGNGNRSHSCAQKKVGHSVLGSGQIDSIKLNSLAVNIHVPKEDVRNLSSK